MASGNVAAQYLRMSTDHQKYSLLNQAAAIAEYASLRGMEIVKTYEDAGRSGVQIKGRSGLIQLIADVRSHKAPYKTILVYDVSRWGRFQDADESAYYEFICKEAGITVQYCAEQFENDGSLSAAIIKNLKRAMAGEYSRELSAKCFAGKCRLVKLGFRQGGAAGHGLRRMLVDEERKPKGLLSRGEYKSIARDRVVLVPGPAEEVATIKRIYRLFIQDGLIPRQIAEQLNREGSASVPGRPWNYDTVRQVLTSEKYIGNNISNRTSRKLHGKFVQNPPEMWARSDGAFEPIISREEFEEAQRILTTRDALRKKERKLQVLRLLLKREGRLTKAIIDSAKGVPSGEAYRRAFGSLVTAYGLVGFTPSRNLKYISRRREIGAYSAEVLKNTVTPLVASSTSVVVEPSGNLLIFDNALKVFVVVLPHRHSRDGFSRWILRPQRQPPAHIGVMVRLAPGNSHILDYFVLPRPALHGRRIVFVRDNEPHLEVYRLNKLSDLVSRISNICRTTDSLHVTARSRGLRTYAEFVGRASNGDASRRRWARQNDVTGAFDREMRRKREFVERGRRARAQLRFLSDAIQHLFADGEFAALAQAERLDVLPSCLSSHLQAVEGR